MRSNKRSDIGGLVTVPPGQIRRNSINIIDAGLIEIPALSLDRFGSNAFYSPEIPHVRYAELAEINIVVNEIRPRYGTVVIRRALPRLFLRGA